MSVRKISVKLGVAAVATTGLAFTALAPATAAGEDSWYQLSNSGYADGADLPANALIGAGSDTIQFVDGALAKAYNATNPTAPMASLSACYEPGSTQADGKTVTPGSTIQTSCTYPTGAKYPFTQGGKALGSIGAGTSGDGANLLDKSGVTTTNVAFARTSGPKDQTNLALYPFALDQVVAVVSNNVPSNAPASLTRAELYGIYAGDYTNWDQLGGKNAPIHAYYPYNPSSGTLAAFYGQLDLESPQGTAAGAGVIVPSNGTPSATGSFVSNTAVASSKLVANGEAGGQIVEHDPAAIENDPDAVAPFSYSRIIMDETKAGDPTSSPIKALGGWVLDRAVFNEVRDYNTTPSTALQGVNPNWIANDPTTSTSPDNIVNSLFGASGYLCGSDAAKTMEAYGFYQLASGICGVETHGNPTSLKAVGAPTQSSVQSTLSADSKSVTVSVASQDTSVTAQPTGKVSVSLVPLDDARATAKAPAPVTSTLSGGTATIALPLSGLPANSQWEVAVSYGGDSSFQQSWSDVETNSVPQTVTVTQAESNQGALAKDKAAVAKDQAAVNKAKAAVKKATTTLKKDQKAAKKAKGAAKKAANRKVAAAKKKLAAAKRSLSAAQKALTAAKRKLAAAQR